MQRSDGDGESEPETTSAVQRPDEEIVCTLNKLPAGYFHLASQVHGEDVWRRGISTIQSVASFRA